MADWLSHTLTALIAFAGGLVPLAMKWRKQTTDQYRELVEDLRARIGVLEKRVEDLHKDHSECLKTQAAQATQIAMLQAQLAGKPA